MSSQLTTFVQVIDGQNYGVWSKAIHAFLMAQGLWGFTDGTNTEPYPPTDPLPIPPLAATASQAESNAHDVLEAQYKIDKAAYEKDLPLHPALFAVWQKGILPFAYPLLFSSVLVLTIMLKKPGNG
jgi:hypothetical protein